MMEKYLVRTICLYRLSDGYRSGYLEMPRYGIKTTRVARSLKVQCHNVIAPLTGKALFPGVTRL